MSALDYIELFSVVVDDFVLIINHFDSTLAINKIKTQRL